MVALQKKSSVRSAITLNNKDDDDMDELIAGTLKQQKQSAEAALRAQQLALQTEQKAAETLDKLHKQGAQLDNIDYKMDDMAVHTRNAEKQTGYLEQVSRHFMIPVFGSKPVNEIPPGVIPKDAVFADQAPKGADGRPILVPRKPIQSMLVESASAQQHQESMQHEQQIDGALSGLAAAVGNIKAMSISASHEIDRQNQVLSSIDTKVDVQSEKVARLNQRVGKLAGK